MKKTMIAGAVLLSATILFSCSESPVNPTPEKVEAIEVETSSLTINGRRVDDATIKYTPVANQPEIADVSVARSKYNVALLLFLAGHTYTGDADTNLPSFLLPGIAKLNIRLHLNITGGNASFSGEEKVGNVKCKYYGDILNGRMTLNLESSVDDTAISGDWRPNPPTSEWGNTIYTKLQGEDIEILETLFNMLPEIPVSDGENQTNLEKALASVSTGIHFQPTGGISVNYVNDDGVQKTSEPYLATYTPISGKEAITVYTNASDFFSTSTKADDSNIDFDTLITLALGIASNASTIGLPVCYKAEGDVTVLYLDTQTSGLFLTKVCEILMTDGVMEALQSSLTSKGEQYTSLSEKLPTWVAGIPEDLKKARTVEIGIKLIRKK